MSRQPVLLACIANADIRLAADAGGEPEGTADLGGEFGNAGDGTLDPEPGDPGSARLRETAECERPRMSEISCPLGPCS